MKRITARLGLAAGILGLGLMVLGPRDARATLDMQKKAKDLGFPAQNCLYCHGEKLPKKGAVTNNDRGKWLIDQKAKKAAKQVDMSWLKEYDEKK